MDSKGQKPSIKLVVHHTDSEKDETEAEEEEEGMECACARMSSVPRNNLGSGYSSLDDAVFQRTIALIESSSSSHFSTGDSGSDGTPRARDVIKIIAHRVVHGGSEDA